MILDLLCLVVISNNGKGFMSECQVKIVSEAPKAVWWQTIIPPHNSQWKDI